MASEPLKLRLLILNNINNTDICYKVLAIETVKLKKDPEVKSQNFEQRDTNAKHSLHSHIFIFTEFYSDWLEMFKRNVNVIHVTMTNKSKHNL